MPGRQRPGETRGTRKRTHSLTAKERRLLRAALKGLRHRLGGWRHVSEAIGVPTNTLWGVSRGTDFGSMGIAQKVARLIGVPVTILLEGRLISTELCPTCGQAKREGH
jgi:hypothetical protein